MASPLYELFSAIHASAAAANGAPPPLCQYRFSPWSETSECVREPDEPAVDARLSAQLCASDASEALHVSAASPTSDRAALCWSSALCSSDVRPLLLLLPPLAAEVVAAAALLLLLLLLVFGVAAAASAEVTVVSVVAGAWAAALLVVVGAERREVQSTEKASKALRAGVALLPTWWKCRGWQAAWTDAMRRAARAERRGENCIVILGGERVAADTGSVE